ncbi:MAG: geranylgeranylglyceryl/heptaprenylglyceryl phosphate synthase [Candidatus Altiarchaeales archaeon ex4484_2]|nr:MAG: geranylgeranylglyceryl/heptaprenylglyceryl phosphate synthase [Candidatus Altiarchaeales archaeon ex4484_2]
MSVIDRMLEDKKKLHFTLIDPENQSPVEATELAGRCQDMGTDAIMVGGSTVKGGVMDEITRLIKKAVTVPVIIFPNNAEAITAYADYIFFMSLLNSRKSDYLIGEQVRGARKVEMYGIEPISLGYIVVSTGKKKTTVEEVADLYRIEPNDVEKVIDYALAAQYMGMECVYLEAGSGASKPVPGEMIEKVKRRIDIPLIIGGGIRDGETAKNLADAGADVIVTGTAAEENLEMVKEIIGGIHMSQLTPFIGK